MKSKLTVYYIYLYQYQPLNSTPTATTSMLNAVCMKLLMVEKQHDQLYILLHRCCMKINCFITFMSKFCFVQKCYLGFHQSLREATVDYLSRPPVQQFVLLIVSIHHLFLPPDKIIVMINTYICYIH